MKMNSRFDGLVDVFEKKLFGFIKNYKNRVIVFLLVAFSLLFLRSIPYLNLIFGKSLQIFLTIISFLLIFRVSLRNICYISIGLIVFSIPFLIWGEISSADYFGELIYGTMSIVVVKLILVNF